jgi:hypothetical protein
VLVYLSYGYTNLSANVANPDYTEAAYSLNYLTFDDSGILNPVVFRILPNNYQQIFGTITPNDTQGPWDADLSLINSLRVFSMGLRVLPTIEQVTNTDSTYVSYYIGGQLSSYEIDRCINNNSDIKTIIKNSNDSATYGNNDGATVRYDPFQVENQLAMTPLSALHNVANDKSNLRLPCVLMLFSAFIEPTDSFPFIVHTQWWMEAILEQPTPIYSSPSPIDPHFESLKAAFSTSGHLYPLVTKGHTLRSFRLSLNAFMSHANSLFKSGSNLFQSAVRTYRTANRAIKTVRRATRPARKKKKRKRRRTPRPRGGPGTTLGTRRMRKARKVRNS